MKLHGFGARFFVFHRRVLAPRRRTSNRRGRTGGRRKSAGVRTTSATGYSSRTWSWRRRRRRLRNGGERRRLVITWCDGAYGCFFAAVTRGLLLFFSLGRGGGGARFECLPHGKPCGVFQLLCSVAAETCVLFLCFWCNFNILIAKKRIYTFLGV